MNWRKIGIIGFLIVAALIAIGYGKQAIDNRPKPPTPTPTPVPTATAVPPVTITCLGGR